MNIWYFGGYKPPHKFPRNKILIEALKQRHKVSEIRASGNLISRYVSLWKQSQNSSKPDVVIVGVPGFQDIPLAKYLAVKYGARLIFDAFIPLHEMYVEDRELYQPESVMAKWLEYWDRLSCKLADAVLLDTQSHVEYYSTFTSLPKDKFHVIPVGTQTKVFDYQINTEANNSEHFTVYYHGNFIPLHGLEIVIKAAEILRDRSDIQFILVGSGSQEKMIRSQIKKKKLTNISLEPPVAYHELAMMMTRADLFLGGPFGSSPKAKRVIPNKVYESVAMKIPVLVGDSPAIKEFVSNAEVTLVEQNNPVKLAEKILWAESHRNQLGTKAERAYRKYLRYAGIKVIADKIETVINKTDKSK